MQPKSRLINCILLARIYKIIAFNRNPLKSMKMVGITITTLRDVVIRITTIVSIISVLTVK